MKGTHLHNTLDEMSLFIDRDLYNEQIDVQNQSMVSYLIMSGVEKIIFE